MSDAPPEPGWWKAADGRWYPPRADDETPGPGWWKASDGRWYPPRPDGQPPAPGWWLASNGRWYPPEKRSPSPTTEPDAATAEASAAPTPQPAEPAPAATADAEPTPVKKVAVKKVAVKKVAVKKVAAKKAPDGAPAAKAAPSAPTKAPAAKAPAAKAPAAKAGGGVVRRQDLDDLDATPTSARSPQEQIAVRNKTSQADARFLATARSAAAARALTSLRSQIQAELGDVPAPIMASPDEAPPAPVPPGAPPAAPAAKAPAAKAPAAKAPAGGDEGPTIDRTPTTTADGETPLMAVKPSAVASDIDRIGDRLVIFADRVELHDRAGRVRQSIPGDQIADVVVVKRFTGHAVTVEAGDGTTIQAKGLRPDQAEEIRALIMRRTRRTGPAPARAAGTGGPTADRPSTTAPTGPAPYVDTADLLAKLDDLHRAGVLTDAELADKRALVATLGRGERLTPAPG